MLTKKLSGYLRYHCDNRCVNFIQFTACLTNLHRKLACPLTFACEKRDNNIRYYVKKATVSRMYIPTCTSTVICEHFPHRLARFPATACASNTTQKINQQISYAKAKLLQLYGSRTSVANGGTIPRGGHTRCVLLRRYLYTSAPHIRYDLIRYTIADGAPSCLHDD